jgi:hypothetical protein
MSDTTKHLTQSLLGVLYHTSGWLGRQFIIYVIYVIYFNLVIYYHK